MTWIYPDPADKTIADGDPGQGTSACCDPTSAWDTFGNLYITYISASVNQIVTILSTDGGATFAPLSTFTGSIDQPTVKAANTSAGVRVWITWNQSNTIVASGAAVTGLGTIGGFSPVQTAPGSGACNFGDIAIAPSGAVVVTCQNPSGGQGPATIRTWVDADGLGAGGFAVGGTVATNVGGFDFIPAQNSRSVDAEAGLTYDNLPSSPRFGRLYLNYADEPVNEDNNLNIHVRFSDNNGITWSAPVQVNDDATVRSQFLQRGSVDPSTGFLGICWHDARNSPTNTAAQMFCSASTNAATPSFITNALISGGSSTSNGAGVEFGDYAGADYVNGVLFSSWADTSNSTGNNPNGTSNFDNYTDRVTGSVPVELMNFRVE